MKMEMEMEMEMGRKIKKLGIKKKGGQKEKRKKRRKKKIYNKWVITVKRKNTMKALEIILKI